MENVKSKKSSAPSFATPLTEAEIVRIVKDAQKGPFYTSEQVKEELQKWKRKRA